MKRSKSPIRVRLAVWTAGIVLGAFAAAAVRAGTVVDVKTTYFDNTRPEEMAKIYFDRDCVRFDASEKGRSLILVSRKDAQGETICWVIDIDAKSYIEVGAAGVAEVKKQKERARIDIEKQIADAPPQNRDKVRQAYEAQYGVVLKKQPVVTFKKMSSGVKIKNWQCAQYESYLDDVKFEDIWAASDKDIGLAAASFRSLADMGELFSGISPETNAFFQTGRATGGFAGFPVVVVRYQGGQKSEKSEVVGVRQEKLDPALFELPQGFAKQELTQ